MPLTATEQAYLDRAQATHSRRMRWWKQARFGMFIHWGLYSQMWQGRSMDIEQIPMAEYEKLAASCKPGKGFARQWARLARQAGMKYMVLTTKHHEGFCLWDTKQTDYNAVQRGPGRDLVREYAEAAREAGLRVGLYYSLLDWRNPDCAASAKDPAARRRFLDFTQGCVRELMSNYGRIDVLWYDIAWPLVTPQEWESFKLNAMVRRLQPRIIINDRAQLPEDYGTPEGSIAAAKGGRAWEACMTFNGAWAYKHTPPEDWLPARKVLDMLRTCTAGGGNLLLNIGPMADGTVPPEARERLTTVGRWLKRYGQGVYGDVNVAGNLSSAAGNWTRKGNRYYLWCFHWPGRDLPVGGLTESVRSVRLLPGGKRLPFSQVGPRLVVSGLPERCPDPIAHVGMLELTFARPVRQFIGWDRATPDRLPADLSGESVSPPVRDWQVSGLHPKPEGGIAQAEPPARADLLDWQAGRVDENGFVNIHDRFGDADGLVYLSTRLRVPQSGKWMLHLGHDGGARVFVDGKAVLCEPTVANPCVAGRSSATVHLSRGTHEVLVALDTCAGRGWGIYLHLEVAQ